MVTARVHSKLLNSISPPAIKRFLLSKRHVKKTVQHFILFLKPVRFIIRTDLKIMPGIFKNENLMAENSSRILKWFIWLSNFNFDIVYKPGYLNCLADMLTREKFEEAKLALSMFSAGASSSNLA